MYILDLFLALTSLSLILHADAKPVLEPRFRALLSAPETVINAGTPNTTSSHESQASAPDISTTTQILANDSSKLGFPFWGSKISEQELDDLRLQAQYSAAAYCDYNDGFAPAQRPVQCKIPLDEAQFSVSAAGNLSSNIPDICPQVEAEQQRTVYEFQNEAFFHGSGFIAFDDTDRRIILSIRGSTDLRNFLDDGLLVQETLDEYCIGCAAHFGFWQGWQNIRPGVIENLKTAIAAHPDFEVKVVGHSLGGAIATLAALDLRSSGITLDLYTFGSPRVGNLRLVQYMITELKRGNNYRIEHQWDVITWVPPASPLFYWHLYPVYRVYAKTGAPVGAGDVRKFGFFSSETPGFVANGSSPDFKDLPQESSGNGANPFGPHQWYFGKIAPCTKNDFLFDAGPSLLQSLSSLDSGRQSSGL